MKKKKIVTIVLFVIIGAAIAFSLYGELWPYWESWKIGYKYEKFEKAFLDYFKNDTFGGKTPEETYNLYVDALKKGDLELASKYFYWRKQVEQKNKLEDLKNKGELEKYINDLPEWGELVQEEYWDKDGKKYTWVEILEESVTVKLPDGAGGFIDHIFQPGEYKQELIFEINTFSNIWKIYSL